MENIYRKNKVTSYTLDARQQNMYQDEILRSFFMYVELRYGHNWRGTELLWDRSIRRYYLHPYKYANKTSRQYKKDMMLSPLF